MLVFTITICSLMAVALTAQQLRIDFYKSKSKRYKTRINTLKTCSDNQQDTIKRLNEMLTDAYAESDRRGHLLNYLDNFLKDDPKFIEAITKLKGGDENERL